MYEDLMKVTDRSTNEHMGSNILDEILCGFSRNLTWVLKKSYMGSQEILLGFPRNLTWVLKSEVRLRLCVLLVDNLLTDMLRQYLVEHVVHR